MHTARLVILSLAASGAYALATPSVPAAAQTPSAQAPRAATELVQEGLAQARAERKHVLVEFGASWCGWCKKFEAFLDDPDVGKLMRDHYVVVHLTALESAAQKALENPGADSVLKANGGVGGIPFFFVLDESGKKVGDANIMPGNSNVGHPATVEEVDAFDGFLERTAPRMTAAERARIHAYLTRIAGR